MSGTKYLVYSEYDSQGNKVLKRAETLSENIVCNGKLGIGTTSPESALHVDGDRNNLTPSKGIHLGKNGNDYAIEICATGSANSSFIDFTYPNLDRRGRILYSHSNDNMVISTAGAEKMRIDQNGNVGIGVTPVTKLQVGSDAISLSDFAASNSKKVTGLEAFKMGWINAGMGTGTTFIWEKKVNFTRIGQLLICEGRVVIRSPTGSGTITLSLTDMGFNTMHADTQTNGTVWANNGSTHYTGVISVTWPNLHIHYSGVSSTNTATALRIMVSFAYLNSY